MNLPSSLLDVFSIATVPSLDQLLGSRRTLGGDVSVSCVLRTNWFWSPSFLRKKYRPPAFQGPMYFSKFHSFLSRSWIALRSGIDSRNPKVALFCSSTQLATSDEVRTSSSSQR